MCSGLNSTTKGRKWCHCQKVTRPFWRGIKVIMVLIIKIWLLHLCSAIWKPPNELKAEMASEAGYLQNSFAKAPPLLRIQARLWKCQNVNKSFLLSAISETLSLLKPDQGNIISKTTRDDWSETLICEF